GHTALSPREDFMLSHNLSEGHFQIHRFPASTPDGILPFTAQTSDRRITIQGCFAEEGKVAVCGSDHGTVYVVDVMTRALLQKLPGA
ncbi:hypothetical protein DXG01_016439, partial [Tephrocybe rancida]